MMAVLWFLVGGFVSVVSIASQWAFIQHLDAHSRRAVRWVFPAGMLMRFAVTGALFWLALMQGVLAGISFIAGLLATRWGILVWVNSRRTVFKQGRTS